MVKMKHFRFLMASVVSASLISGQVLAQTPPAAPQGGTVSVFAPSAAKAAEPAETTPPATEAPLASAAIALPADTASPEAAVAPLGERVPEAAPAALTVSAPAAAPNVAPLAGTNNEWQQEFALWQAADGGNSVEEYQGYLAAYPTGKFAPIAKARIVKLSDEESAALDRQHEPADSTPVTPGLSLGTPETENPLLGEKATRREVQGRLTALGFATGGTDGALGPKSRTAIAQWQNVASAPSTGYLAYDQLAKLRADSEQRYQAWLASRPKAPARVSNRARPAPGDELVGRVNDSSGADAAIALGVLGLAAGVIGGAAIGRHRHHGPRYYGGPRHGYRHHR